MLVNSHLPRSSFCLGLVIWFACSICLSRCLAQDSQNQGPKPPAIELLSLSGSKPNLSSTGEGITSIKASHIYKLGVTTVKPFDSSLKIELPVGYTLFNNLAYIIETDVVYSGPNDFTFRIPSANTKEQFDKLRILFADYDQAEPQKPRWIDITLTREVFDEWKTYLPKPEFDNRLPNLETRSLHGFMFDRPVVLVVATKDLSIARDNLVADLVLSGKSEPEQVMEGRDIKFTFTITNKGPDSATSVSFASHVDPSLVSINQSQGVCRWDAHNIYCNLGEIRKDASATITFHGRASWNFFHGDQPGTSGGMDATPQVESAEGDPDFENNRVFLSASVLKDPNKPPVVEIATPTQDQFFVGPEPNVRILVNAYDPDGTISDVQIYNEKGLLGNAKPTDKNRFELTYEKAPFGRHLLQAIVKDNLGRPTETPITSFHVNGQANVEIVSPQPNQVIIGPLQELVVKVRASDPARKLTKVTVHNGIQFGGVTQEAHSTGQKDEYAATFRDLGAGRLTFYVDVVDDAGVQTLTYPIEFKVTSPPNVKLSYSDGEYSRDLQNGTVLPAGAIKLLVYVHDFYDLDHPAVTNLEVSANGKRICHYSDKNRKQPTTISLDIIECPTTLKSGTYTLSATVTDSDGATGKSKPVEIVVR